MQSLATEPGWQAALQLGFSRHEQRTRLTRRKHFGPLQVQRPFYPEADGTCHLYLLHPPGGVVGGDCLSLTVHLDEAAQVLLTTPAAAKFYRSKGIVARQQQTMMLAEHACLEWLPQETIVYDGAQVNTTTRIELSASSYFIGWDILCLGRPAAAESFLHGHYRQSFELLRNKTPLFIEHNRYDSAAEILHSAWGLQRQPVTATLVCTNHCTSQQRDLVSIVRTEIEKITQPHELFSVSQLQDVLICRYLGNSTERAKLLFIQVWSVIREIDLSKPMCSPRIWNV